MEAQPMRLQDLRLKEGMSLEQLAELSGVDHDRLVMFENNPETIRNMHLDTARQIAKALHCNVLELHPDEGWRGGIHCAESGLRDIRRTRGYTQNELSEMTGIFPSRTSLGLRQAIARPQACGWIQPGVCRKRFDAIRQIS